MEKARLVEALRAQLAGELEVLKAAAAAAREGATHEEAKPENEYDTRGLEQSYLAGAQTARVEALAAALDWLEALKLPELGADDAVCLGACVVVDSGEDLRRYFLSSAGGGTKLKMGSDTWWVLSPSSPLGRRLLGKRLGDVVEHLARGESLELELTEVY